MNNELYIEHQDDFTNIYGEQDPSRCGYWVLNTNGVEIWEIDGPFDSEEEADARLAEIEKELGADVVAAIAADGERISIETIKEGAERAIEQAWSNPCFSLRWS